VECRPIYLHYAPVVNVKRRVRVGQSPIPIPKGSWRFSYSVGRVADLNVLAALMADVDLLTIGDIAHRPAWMRDGLCLEYPDVNFFPTQGESTGPAKAVCAGYLVRSECLAYALERRHRRGVDVMSDART
jgi:hypothetical protein